MPDADAVPQGPVRIFLLDDHHVVRRALAALLATEPGLEVVGEASTVQESLGRVLACKPDVAVLDVHLADGSGIDVCREIRSARPTVYCIALTSDTSAESMLAAVLAGASAYVRKEARPEKLVDTIRQVAQGRSVLDHAVVVEAMERVRRAERSKDHVVQLSRRERDVLDLIAEGLTNRQIAEKLYLAEKTVKNYVTALLGKLGMQRRTQAAIYRAGLGS